MHDTFFFQPDEKGERKVLRTHTSPVQVRTMEIQKPPIRIVIPGKTYRQDSDATHSPMFHQVEGLVVDKKSHVGNMRWILEEFCKAFFEVDNITMRFPPVLLPLHRTELRDGYPVRPLVRPDRQVRRRHRLDGNPRLRHGSPERPARRRSRSRRIPGFAWGMGLDRIAMLKYGMPDLRDFFNADVRWMSHYGFRPLDMPTLFGGLSV